MAITINLFNKERAKLIEDATGEATSNKVYLKGKVFWMTPDENVIERKIKTGKRIGQPYYLKSWMVDIGDPDEKIASLVQFADKKEDLLVIPLREDIIIKPKQYTDKEGKEKVAGLVWKGMKPPYDLKYKESYEFSVTKQAIVTIDLPEAIPSAPDSDELPDGFDAVDIDVKGIAKELSVNEEEDGEDLL